jgi:hypothetical protein
VKIVQSKRQRPLTYKLDAPEFTREFAPVDDSFLDYFFEAGERVHMVIGIDTSDFFKAKVLKHINMQDKFVLDLRFTSKPSLDSLSSILSLKVLKRCAEIHVDSEFRIGRGNKSTPEALIMQAAFKCDWLFIKDCNFVFMGDQPLQDKDNSSPCHSLTLIDSKIVNLESLLEASEAKDNLTTLVLIYNQDEDSYFASGAGDEHIVTSLLASNIKNFKCLTYFELSFYNDVQEPFISTDDVHCLLKMMPPSVVEVCIYCQDEVFNVDKFSQVEEYRRFSYLEIGFNRIF